MKDEGKYIGRVTGRFWFYVRTGDEQRVLDEINRIIRDYAIKIVVREIDTKVVENDEYEEEDYE